MLNSLLKLFDDSNLSYLENRLYAGLENLKRAFNTSFSSFEDDGDCYVLHLDVADDAKASNVTIDYDDETREISVKYAYNVKNFKNSTSIVETLPEDADEDTIDAIVENGTLTVTVEKKQVDEEPVEEEDDDTVVKINRKNRK